MRHFRSACASYRLASVEKSITVLVYIRKSLNKQYNDTIHNTPVTQYKRSIPETIGLKIKVEMETLLKYAPSPGLSGATAGL